MRTVVTISILWGLVTLLLGFGALISAGPDSAAAMLLALLMGQSALWVPFYVLRSSRGVSRNT